MDWIFPLALFLVSKTILVCLLIILCDLMSIQLCNGSVFAQIFSPISLNVTFKKGQFVVLEDTVSLHLLVGLQFLLYVTQVRNIQGRCARLVDLRLVLLRSLDHRRVRSWSTA